MQLTEKEISEIKLGYDGNHSPELLNYLKRHFKTHEVEFDWMKGPIKMISIDDKTYHMEENKKYLVSKISQYVENEWTHIGIPKIRKTVKYFLDGIK